LCREVEILRIDAGPQAIAITFRPGTPAERAKRMAHRSSSVLTWRKGRLVYHRATKSLAVRQRLILALVNKLRRLTG
jgi:transcription-repair coupling factor (superfamily II helicase)